MGNDVKIVFEEVAERCGITKLEEDIIDWTKINIFHVADFHVVKNTSGFHLGIDSAVSSWS